MDFPQTNLLPRSINTVFSPYSAGRELTRYGATSETLASASWGTASRAYYIPFWLPWPYPVRRVFWGNGSVLTGTKDFGIYTTDGTKIYSTGSTAEAGASALQYVTPPSLLLYPGRYYMAITCSATTNHGWGPTSITVNYAVLTGMLVQATALPLPDTATFAAFTTGILPLCGITQYAT